jgi:hypothetical protein
MTASTPPGASLAKAAGSARSMAPISSLTAMRMPWKGAGGGMDAALALHRSREGIDDELGERTRAGQRPGAAGGLDGRDDAAPILLLPEVTDGADEGIVARDLEPTGGGLAGARVHAHVGRGVVAEGEAAVGLVELEGRDAEIEKDAVEP